METSELVARIRALEHRDLAAVAAGAGISHATLAAIKYGLSKDPRSSTIDRLRAYFVSKSELKPNDERK